MDKHDRIKCHVNDLNNTQSTYFHLQHVNPLSLAASFFSIRLFVCNLSGVFLF